MLAKVGKAKFYREVRPGDVIRYEVTVDDLRADGAIVHGSATVGGQWQSEVELVFAHLDQRFEGVDLFYPADFLAILRLAGGLRRRSQTGWHSAGGSATLAGGGSRRQPGWHVRAARQQLRAYPRVG